MRKAARSALREAFARTVPGAADLTFAAMFPQTCTARIKFKTALETCICWSPQGLRQGVKIRQAFAAAGCECKSRNTSGCVREASADATQNGRIDMVSEFQMVMPVAHTVLKC